MLVYQSMLFCIHFIQVTPTNANGSASTRFLCPSTAPRLLRQSSIQSPSNGWPFHVPSLFQPSIWLCAPTLELPTPTIITSCALQLMNLKGNSRDTPLNYTIIMVLRTMVPFYSIFLVSIQCLQLFKLKVPHCIVHLYLTYYSILMYFHHIFESR